MGGQQSSSNKVAPQPAPAAAIGAGGGAPTLTVPNDEKGDSKSPSPQKTPNNKRASQSTGGKGKKSGLSPQLQAEVEAQAAMYPHPVFHEQTARFASFLDKYHMEHLKNANKATVTEIWSKYDENFDRRLNKSEMKEFSADLVNRVCRQYGEILFAQQPNLSAQKIVAKVYEEKYYMLPGKKHDSDDDSVKGMLSFVRSIVDVNRDGKVTNAEMAMQFPKIMRKVFAAIQERENQGKDGKGGKEGGGMACAIQ